MATELVEICSAGDNAALCRLSRAGCRMFGIILTRRKQPAAGKAGALSS